MKKISEDSSLLKQPSAWIPIAISLAALAFLVGYVAIFGITRNTGGDEGAPARIFQLLMAARFRGVQPRASNSFEITCPGNTTRSRLRVVVISIFQAFIS